MKYNRHLQAGALWVLALVLTIGLVHADPAQAWGKKKDKEKHNKLELRAVNLHKHPDMVFKRGTLKQDAFGGWKLDEIPLGFDRNSRITQRDAGFGQTVTMEEGHEARVMGHMTGQTLVIHRLTMISVDESVQRGSFAESSQELNPGEGNGSEAH